MATLAAGLSFTWSMLRCASLGLARAYRGRAAYEIAVGRADQASAL